VSDRLVPIEQHVAPRDQPDASTIVSGVGPDVEESVMARTSWFDDRAEHPLIHDQIEKLESFTSALADGVVSKQELAAQEERLVKAMKTLEPELSEELHGKVTTVLVELSAYNVMRLLHELQAERARIAFSE
jgi:hypothetical protein